MLTIGQAMARASILSPQCAAMSGSIADSFHELASLQTEINVIFLHDRFKLSLMRIRPASSGSVFWPNYWILAAPGHRMVRGYELIEGTLKAEK
jgi:hypothetical protein